MHRRELLGLILALMVPTAANAGGPPVISFSIYAPLQKDSPVRIVGLNYGEHGVQFTLSNVSERATVGVALTGIIIVPSACLAVQGHVPSFMSLGNAKFRLGPGEKRLTTTRDGYGLPPQTLVGNAGHLQAAYLQIQVGVVEVNFADGKNWKADEELRPAPTRPIDPSLAAADVGKCSDAPAVIRALRATEGVKLDRGVEKVSYGDDPGGSAPPRLFLSCTLGGPIATCPSR